MRVLEGEGYWHPAELDWSLLKKIKQDKSTFHRGGHKAKASSKKNRFPSETNQTPWSKTLESLLFAGWQTVLNRQRCQVNKCPGVWLIRLHFPGVIWWEYHLLSLCQQCIPLKEVCDKDFGPVYFHIMSFQHWRYILDQ